MDEISELCPYCEYEVKLKNKFEVQTCTNCGKSILPCSLCNMDKVDCSKCPLENNKNKKETSCVNEKLNINKMANILINEAELLHCTIEEAWEGMASDVTSQFNFKEVKSLIVNLNAQYKNKI